MRRLKRTFELTLAGLGLSLLAGVAQANVVLVGTPEGRPGDEVELSIVAESRTTFSSIDIVPFYESFDSVLALVDFQPSTSMADDASGALCVDNLCSYIFADGKLFAHETVLATWHFKVTSNAEDFVDTQGDRTFPFDLNILVDGQYTPLPEDQFFRVLAVPEPSSWGLIAAGILLLIVTRYRRGQEGFGETLRRRGRLPR